MAERIDWYPATAPAFNPPVIEAEPPSAQGAPATPMSIEQAVQLRAVARRAARLMARWAHFARPFAQAYADAGVRLAYERSMGLMPRRRRVTVADMEWQPGAAMDAAREGEHVTIAHNGEPAAVMVSADEYERLLADRAAFESMVAGPPDADEKGAG